jgi:hypothetical protein
VVLLPDHLVSLGAFRDFVAQERLTVLNLPASYWHAWVAELEHSRAAIPPTLRLMIVGSELVLPERFAAWRRLAGERVRWCNAYGPTETTITATLYDPAPGSPPDQALLPIGQPLGDTQVYLLDAHMQPVPVGVPGELYIGGSRLARGYLNRPDLTAERFIPNPFADRGGEGERERGGESEDGGWNSAVGGRRSAVGGRRSPALPLDRLGNREVEGVVGGRLYKTGDLCRYRRDGNIEFLGRLDQQVKLRGFRIELGEIEATLGRHPAVRDAVVLAQNPDEGRGEEESGAKRLVAYIVPTTDHRPPTTDHRNEQSGQFSILNSQFSIQELRAFLHQHLPDYMIPSAFVVLDALPLTTLGKVDRAALRAPDLGRAAAGDTFVAARGPVEAALAQIWADVLRLERIGVDDNFFALGGDSILSIQIVARANQAGLHLTPRDMFQYQTIAALAAVVDAAPVAPAAHGLVTGPVPCTPIQRWFFGQEFPDPHHFNQALLLSVRRPIDPALLERAWQHLIVHHDALRMRYTRATDEWRQINMGVVEQPVVVRVDLSALPMPQREEALAAAVAEFHASLSLEDGRLVRAVLIEMGAGEPGRLLLVIHHLVVDGVSWRVLLEDLQAAYTQLQRGADIVLPPKTTSFKEWAERLAAYARSDTPRDELAYWLADDPATHARLPLDRLDGENVLAAARSVSVTLGVEETRALLREVPQAYRTQINDVLLAALVQAIGQWTGDRTLLVDLEGHGREDLFADVDLSRTVGWCTSIFPVRLDLSEADGPGAALKAVKEQLRRVPRRGIGYGLLRHLAGDAEISARLEARPAP